MAIDLLSKLDTNVSSKICSLSKEKRCYFNKRLMEVLNDKYSCFVYGGINRKEYASLSQDKIEKVKINLYKEMFEKITPPARILVEFPRSKN
jgi:hypothetical protein